MSRPLLVVTVAAPTMAELRRRRDAVVGADLVELRLDLVSDPDVAGALASRRTPVIVTCRAKWEGGHFEGSEVERRRILDCAVQLGAEYVDVEFKADFARELIASTGGKRIVVSTHDFEGVPDDLIDRVRSMRAMGAEVVKVSVMARSLADNLRLLQLERMPNTALIGMGPAGVPTRVLAAHFHSCWSYAGDGHAPGMIAASRMLEEFRFREVTDRTRDLRRRRLAAEPLDLSGDAQRRVPRRRGRCRLRPARRVECGGLHHVCNRTRREGRKHHDSVQSRSVSACRRRRRPEPKSRAP